MDRGKGEHRAAYVLDIQCTREDTVVVADPDSTLTQCRKPFINRCVCLSDLSTIDSPFRLILSLSLHLLYDAEIGFGCDFDD